MVMSNKTVDVKKDAADEDCDCENITEKDPCDEMTNDATPVNVVPTCPQCTHFCTQVNDCGKTGTFEPRIDLLRWCRDNETCAKGVLDSFLFEVKRCFPALFPDYRKDTFWYSSGKNAVVKAPKKEAVIQKPPVPVAIKPAKLTQNTCTTSYSCTFFKILTLTLEVLCIGGAIYYFVRWYYLKSAYNAVVRVKWSTDDPVTGNHTHFTWLLNLMESVRSACPCQFHVINCPQCRIPPPSYCACSAVVPFVVKPNCLSAAASSPPEPCKGLSSQGGCFFRFVKGLMCRIFLTVLMLLPIHLAAYYWGQTIFNDYTYAKIYDEVREAQSDRKILEEELTKIQAKAPFVGDEIGDTRRHIMLSEIERITQYLNKAKSEITNLVKQKDALKEELNVALRERDKAKYEYAAAVDSMRSPKSSHHRRSRLPSSPSNRK